MTSAKKIAWESWNALCEEIESQQMIDEPEEDVYSDSQMEIPQEFLMIPPRTISSPMGIYPEDSVLRPSKRWDCWIGHTNFDLTYDISNIIEEIDGVEALKIMGRYSFFIGVAKLFDIKDVRKNIEQKLCLYTEQVVFIHSIRNYVFDLSFGTNKYRPIFFRFKLFFYQIYSIFRFLVA